MKEGSAARFPPGNTYWEDNLAHPVYDAFWQARAIAPHLRDVTPAVLTVGGWYDAEDLAGPLRIYRAIERQSPSASNRLVMGPWAHGGWSRGDGDKLGALAFGARTGAEFRDRFERPFFEHHLRDAALAEEPEAAVFVTGENAWRTPPAWPPADATARTFFLREGGALAEAASSARGDRAVDEYVSDPNRPVPYVPSPGTGMRRDYMTEDQRFAATRPDVLVYQTPPLADDLTIVGPIHVSLQVSTSGTDADWVVKVIDVYPDDASAPAGSAGTRLAGYQQLVRGEPFRGKFRDSFERPAPFVPGKPAAIAFDLPDVAHTFRKGHRLMVHVQSSWFPLIDRNPAGVHGHPGGEGRRLPDGHPPRLAIGGPPVVDPRAGLAGGGETHHRAVTRREGPLDDRVQAAASRRRDAHRSDRRYPRTRQSASHAPCAFCGQATVPPRVQRNGHAGGHRASAPFLHSPV